MQSVAWVATVKSNGNYIVVSLVNSRRVDSIYITVPRICSRFIYPYTRPQEQFRPLMFFRVHAFESVRFTFLADQFLYKSYQLLRFRSRSTFLILCTRYFSQYENIWIKFIFIRTQNRFYICVIFLFLIFLCTRSFIYFCIFIPRTKNKKILIIKLRNYVWEHVGASWSISLRCKGITLFSGGKWLYTYTLGISEVGGFHYDS